MSASTPPSLWRAAPRLALVLLACLLSGCDLLSPAGGKQQAAESDAAPKDVFAAAAEDAEPGERPYLEAVRPMLEAIAKRDYKGLYGHLSSHAVEKVDSFQFVPPADPSASEGESLENLTEEEFVEWMGKMQQQLGEPHSVQSVYVETVDPQVLAGKGDRLEVLMAIGGMPEEIPEQIRKAAIRAAIRCQLDAASTKMVAAEMGISEAEVRAGRWPEGKSLDEEQWPYLNLKLVLVEEERKLKIGYFEFMPPSVWD
jgi:hypothetical protein